MDSGAVSQVLTRYLDAARAAGAEGKYRVSQEAVLIAVVDTGIARDDVSRLPFVRSRDESEAPPVEDSDGNGYPNDIIGVDLIQERGDPIDPDGYPNHGHGLQISSVASGASLMPPRSPITRLVGLKMLSIVDNLTSEAGQPPVWRVIPAHFVTSINYMRKLGVRRPVIANWSWEARGSAPSVIERLRDGQELIVVAAGNSGRPLNNETMEIPSRFSLASGAYVMAVGALRPDGKLADFSNYGSNVVTLAAPGCSIPVFLPAGAKGIANGTSVASPLVALTAAMIKGLNDSASVEALHNRIIAASDHLPGIDGKVIGGRALNVLDSISVYDDVIRLKNGTTLRGSILGGVDALSDDQTVLRISDVLRYTVSPRTDGTFAVEMLMNRMRENLQTQSGTLRSRMLRFQPVGARAEDISPAQIAEIIPAMIR